MLRLISENLETPAFSFVTKNKVILCTVLVVSISLFCYQSYIYVSRYLQRDVQVIITSMQNESLLLPVVSLMYRSVRSDNRSMNEPGVQLKVTKMKIENEQIPDWAYKFFVSSSNEQIMSVNVLNYSNLKKYNLTLENAKQKWPLKAKAAGSPHSGITIYAYFNAKNFIEYPDADMNHDYIELAVSSFETDAPLDSMIKFQLLPCERIDVVVAFEHYTTINRLENPCRDEYPDELLKALLKLPMHPTNLYNSIFAPELPYNDYMCNLMCHTNYWLPKCNCYVYYEIWFYAGRPNNTIVCPKCGLNCTSSKQTIQETPTLEIDKCKCYPKCRGYRFRLIVQEKQKYGVGKYEY